jgi:hypothetical protein
MDNIDFFLSVSVTHARSLPLEQCVCYLRGLAAACEDGPMVDRVRGVAHELRDCDEQLERIAAGHAEEES